jgi:hypothetical protein
MASSGMLRRVALVRTDVSEELRSSFIRVTRVGELGTSLAVTSNRARCEEIFAACILVRANVVPSSPIFITVMMEPTGTSETSFLTRATRCNIPEDGILPAMTHSDF